MKREFAAFMVTAVLAGSLAACGGSDDSTFDQSKLISMGDEVCKAHREVLNEKAAAVLSSNPSRAELVKFVKTTVIPSYEDELKTMRALPPEAAAKQGWDAMLDKFEQGIKKMKADPAATLDSSTKPLAQASKAAEKFGMKVCGQEG